MRHKKEPNFSDFPLPAGAPVHITPAGARGTTRIGTKVTTLHVDGGEDEAATIDVVVVNGRRFLPEHPIEEHLK